MSEFKETEITKIVHKFGCEVYPGNKGKLLFIEDKSNGGFSKGVINLIIIAGELDNFGYQISGGIGCCDAASGPYATFVKVEN